MIHDMGSKAKHTCAHNVAHDGKIKLKLDWEKQLVLLFQILQIICITFWTKLQDGDRHLHRGYRVGRYCDAAARLDERREA